MRTKKQIEEGYETPPKNTSNKLDSLEKDDDDESVQEPTHNLNPCNLRLFFGFILTVNILVNIDHGCIPACTVPLKNEYGLNNTELGLLGSIVYVGLLLGSFSAPPSFHHLPAKLIILICMLANAGSLLLFTLTDHFFWLCIARLAVGFFQVFLCIYFPVWVDVFASTKSKTIWLTILQASVPFGIVIGYAMTALFVNQADNWKISYYIQAGLYVVLTVILILIGKQYVEEERKDEDDEEEDVSDGESESDFVTDSESDFTSNDERGYMSNSSSIGGSSEDFKKRYKM